MANSVNDEVVSFDSALREASVFRNLIFLVHQSRKKKRNNCYTGSGKNLLPVLPNGFGKSLIQVLVPIKEIMTGKLSSVVFVFPLQCIVHDQME